MSASLTLLLGGARSGKSAGAQQWAAHDRSVTVIAPGMAIDGEMAARIEQHRQDRPDHWATVESPYELDTAITGCDTGDTIIIDCLTTWVGNLMARGTSAVDIEALSCRALTAVADRSGRTIAISNEVGLGIVPVSELGREYRDLLGRVNQQWAAAATEAWLVIAGRLLALHELPSIDRPPTR